MADKIYVASVTSIIFNNNAYYIVKARVADESKTTLLSVKGNLIGNNLTGQVRVGSIILFKGSEPVKDKTGSMTITATQSCVNPKHLKGEAKNRFNEWVEAKDRGLFDVFALLIESGLPSSLVTHIAPEILQNSDILSTNPWKFVCKGVPFEVADNFARFTSSNPNIDFHHPDRISGAIYAFLIKNSREHCYGILTDLYKALEEWNIHDGMAISIAIRDLVKSNEVHVENISEDSNTKAIFLKSYYNMEVDCSQLLSSPLRRRASVFLSDVEIQNHCSYPLTTEQIQAIHLGLKEPVSLITGLPGTGKTTTLKTLCKILIEQGERVLLVAPTGIAAKRIESVTSIPAFTIHRAFGAGLVADQNKDKPISDYNGLRKDLETEPTLNVPNLDPTKEVWAFSGGSKGRRKESVLIIDESSMLDLHLLWRVLKGVSDACRLVFVGDVQQLPPVSAGFTFRDMLESNVIPKTELKTIFRQGAGSSIAMACYDIHQEKMPRLEAEGFFENQTDPSKKEGIEFQTRSVADAVADQIVEICLGLKEEMLDFHVVSPIWGKEAGVSELNKRLREALNPVDGLTPIYKSGNDELRVGDRVTMVKNDYDLLVYNGDIGVLTTIEKDNLIVIFDDFKGNGNLVEIPKKKATELLRLAYATTVHKAQGLEYDVIVMPVLHEFGNILQKNLVYTAITRAKKRVYLVGNKKALEGALTNNKSLLRRGKLKERLISSVKK